MKKLKQQHRTEQAWQGEGAKERHESGRAVGDGLQKTGDAFFTPCLVPVSSKDLEDGRIKSYGYLL